MSTHGIQSNPDDIPHADGEQASPDIHRQSARWQFWSIEQRTLRWFGAEIIVVVAGVLIALALNAWWQARHDRSAEQAYLRAIVTDLDNTSGSLERAISGNENTVQSITKLLNASVESVGVSHDSLVVWSRKAQFVTLAAYSVGSAKALVATGELQLVRNDSVRLTISRLLDDVDQAREAERWLFEIMTPLIERIARKTTSLEVYADLERMAPPRLQVALDSSLLRSIQRRGRPPDIEVEELIRDKGSVKDLLALLDGMQSLNAWRGQVLIKIKASRSTIASAVVE